MPTTTYRKLSALNRGRVSYNSDSPGRTDVFASMRLQVVEHDMPRLARALDDRFALARLCVDPGCRRRLIGPPLGPGLAAQAQLSALNRGRVSYNSDSPGRTDVFASMRLQTTCSRMLAKTSVRPGLSEL
jgi:hypothetical protein